MGNHLSKKERQELDAYLSNLDDDIALDILGMRTQGLDVNDFNNYVYRDYRFLFGSKYNNHSGFRNMVEQSFTKEIENYRPPSYFKKLPRKDVEEYAKGMGLSVDTLLKKGEKSSYIISNPDFAESVRNRLLDMPLETAEDFNIFENMLDFAKRFISPWNSARSGKIETSRSGVFNEIGERLRQKGMSERYVTNMLETIQAKAKEYGFDYSDLDNLIKDRISLNKVDKQWTHEAHKENREQWIKHKRMKELEEELNNFQKGSPEYIALEKEINNLTVELSDPELGLERQVLELPPPREGAPMFEGGAVPSIIADAPNNATETAIETANANPNGHMYYSEEDFQNMDKNLQKNVEVWKKEAEEDTDRLIKNTLENMYKNGQLNEEQYKAAMNNINTGQQQTGGQGTPSKNVTSDANKNIQQNQTKNTTTNAKNESSTQANTNTTGNPQSSKQKRKAKKQRKQANNQGKNKHKNKNKQQQTQQQQQTNTQQQTQQQTTNQKNPNTQQSTNSQQQSQNTSNTKVPPKNYATVDDSSIIEKQFSGDGYTGNIKNGYVQDITIGSDTFDIKTNVADGSIDIFDSTGNLVTDKDIVKDINEKVFDQTGNFYKGLTDEEWDTVIENAENFRFNANQTSEKLLEKDAKMMNMNDAINTRQKILEEEREAIKKTAENTKGKKNKKKLSDQRNTVDIKWNEAERIKQINQHNLEARTRRRASTDKFKKTLGLDAYEAGSDEFKQAFEALKGTDEFNAAMDVFKKDLKDIRTVRDVGIKETNRVIDAKIKGLTGKGLTLSNAITIGSAAIGAVNKYKESRAEGKGMVSSAARAGASAIAAEVMGVPATFAVMGARALGNAAVEAGDMLYKESRRMNSMSNFTPLGGVNFQDSQELATMRQSGMELAKMSQYNLEQTLMGAEAKYLHR